MCVTESWSDLFLPDIVRKKEPTAGSLANKKLTMGPHDFRLARYPGTR